MFLRRGEDEDVTPDLDLAIRIDCAWVLDEGRTIPFVYARMHCCSRSSTALGQSALAPPLPAGQLQPGLPLEICRQAAFLSSHYQPTSTSSSQVGGELVSIFAPTRFCRHRQTQRYSTSLRYTAGPILLMQSSGTLHAQKQLVIGIRGHPNVCTRVSYGRTVLPLNIVGIFTNTTTNFNGHPYFLT